MAASYSNELENFQQWFKPTATGDSQHKQYDKDLKGSPLISLAAKWAVSSERMAKVFPQYSIIGMHIDNHRDDMPERQPVLFNTNTPTSVFLCGSQGSGKSHKMACMIESCLRKHDGLGKLLEPLAGVVFHYDNAGAMAPAEIAQICKYVPVNVLVSRSHFHALNKAYTSVEGANSDNMTVKPMLFRDEQMTVKRILQLMAFSSTSDTGLPLYMSVLVRLLRKTALEGDLPNVPQLERDLRGEQFAPSQLTMLDMRMKLLQSFCASCAEKGIGYPPVPKEDVFTLEPGTLTIIDLSDPFVHTCLDGLRPLQHLPRALHGEQA
jgi:hypothetical protein